MMNRVYRLASISFIVVSQAAAIRYQGDYDPFENTLNYDYRSIPSTSKTTSRPHVFVYIFAWIITLAIIRITFIIMGILLNRARELIHKANDDVGIVRRFSSNQSLVTLAESLSELLYFDDNVSTYSKTSDAETDCSQSIDFSERSAPDDISFSVYGGSVSAPSLGSKLTTTLGRSRSSTKSYMPRELDEEEGSYVSGVSTLASSVRSRFSYNPVRNQKASSRQSSNRSMPDARDEEEGSFASTRGTLSARSHVSETGKSNRTESSNSRSTSLDSRDENESSCFSRGLPSFRSWYANHGIWNENTRDRSSGSKPMKRDKSFLQINGRIHYDGRRSVDSKSVNDIAHQEEPVAMNENDARVGDLLQLLKDDASLNNYLQRRARRRSSKSLNAMA